MARCLLPGHLAGLKQQTATTSRSATTTRSATKTTIASDRVHPGYTIVFPGRFHGCSVNCGGILPMVRANVRLVLSGQQAHTLVLGVRELA